VAHPRLDTQYGWDFESACSGWAAKPGTTPSARSPASRPPAPAIADINELTKQTQSEVTAEALEMTLKMVDYQVGLARLGTLGKHASRPSRPAVVRSAG